MESGSVSERIAQFAITVLLMLALGVGGLGLARGQHAQEVPGHALRACVARQMAGDRPGALLANPARFDCQTPQSHLGPGNYWVRLVRSDAPPSGAETLLSFVPSWQGNATLFGTARGGGIAAVPLSNTALARYSRIGAQVTVPIEALDPAKPLLMRIDRAVNPSGLIAQPGLQTAATASAIELREATMVAAFVGLVVALLAFNLLYWMAMGERFQLIYCLAVTAMAAYACAHSGVLARFCPGLDLATTLRLSYLALGLVAASAMRFVFECLEPGTVSRWLIRLGTLNGAAILAASLAIQVVPPDWGHLADRGYLISLVPLVPIMVLTLVQAWRRRSRAVRILALAWTAPLVMAVVRIAHASNLIGYNLAVEHSVIVAMSLESLISALAVSLRIKRVARERDNARAEERIARRMAEIDPLTGLLNRRAMLDRALACGATGDPLRLFLIDIDHFKAINDGHGHDAGDEVIREVAAVLARTAAIRGSVARLGGEEFALLGASRDLPDALAQEILADIRALEIAGEIRVTVSIGIADGAVADEAGWRTLYRTADAGLYRAKNQGRNRALHAAAAEARAA